MIVSIRMARYGRIHRPCYKIVAIDARKRLRGKPLEYLGIFHPQEKGDNRLRLNLEKINYWVSVGARISKRVLYLTKQVQKTQ